ncbi:hypothetical protein FRC11_010613 [Ceratobasidium sp. 423]|nr:hypothetical protein FRC11_010613 [Ceratobasidium sp. 423]
MSDILDDILGSQPNEIEDDETDEVLTGPEGNDADVPRSVCALQLLADAGISFSELLDDVFLGDKSVRDKQPVMNSSSMHIWGIEHENTVNELKEWANKTTVDILHCKLAMHAESTKAGDVECEVVDEESLKKLTLDAITEEVQENALTLYNMLLSICESTRQEKNTQKDSKFSVTLLINALAFQLSHKNNKMQKLICIYLKAKGVPKSCFFFFQKASLLLSYKLSHKALDQVSDTAMDAAIEVFKRKPCISIYDNIRLAQAVKHEWGSHKTVTDNGTAMTIVPMHDSEQAMALLHDPDAITEHWNGITQCY